MLHPDPLINWSSQKGMNPGIGGLGGIPTGIASYGKQ